MPKPSRFQDIDLAPAALHLLENALAPATRKNYDSACSSYETHSRRYGYVAYPASVKSITHWLASLTTTVKPETANGYLEALRSTHIEKGFPTNIFDDPLIKMCIRGAKRVYGEGDKRLRLPLTAPILLKVIVEARDDFDAVNIKAALCVAFAGFLRSGEFTWDTPNSALLRRHVVFNKDSVTLTLPSSKLTPSEAVSRFNLLHRHPHFVLSPHSAIFIPGADPTKPNLCSLAPSVLSTGNISSTKSESYSSERALQQL